MSEDNRRFMMELRGKLFETFNLDEFETLCFDLGVDYDDLQGRAKQTKINALIMTMARTGRLPELLEYVAAERTHLTWPVIPDHFSLPAAGGLDGEAPTYIVNTSGGMFVAGNINSGGGNVSGRDTHVAGDMAGATHFELSGDFRGAILNMQSRLDHVTQELCDSRNVAPDQRVSLVRLVNELRHELSQVPPEQVADADAIARRVEVLADEVRNETPDRGLVEQIGDSLRKAAEKLAPRLPRVVTIVSAIVELVKIMTR